MTKLNQVNGGLLVCAIWAGRPSQCAHIKGGITQAVEAGASMALSVKNSILMQAPDSPVSLCISVVY